MTRGFYTSDQTLGPGRQATSIHDAEDRVIHMALFNTGEPEMTPNNWKQHFWQP